MLKLFSNKSGNGPVFTPTILDGVLNGLREQLNQSGPTFATPDQARKAISMESIDRVDSEGLETTINKLSVGLESIVAGTGMQVAKKFGDNGLTRSQMYAAEAMAIISSDPKAFLSAPVVHEIASTKNTAVMNLASNGDYQVSRLREALEAYDDKDNKSSSVYSVAYNLQSARQDEFGETFFPTVVVTPDQVGYTVSIRLILIYSEIRRQISGDLDQFRKRNIIDAVVDPTLLKNDLTRIVPVYRDESKAHFVDPALVPPRNVIYEDVSISTAPLKMGDKFSLLAISQTEALLETGLQDTTDSIDTALVLGAIYVQLGTGANAEVIRFTTAGLPTATFNYSVQGNTRLMRLAYDTTTLRVDKTTTKVDSSASVLLKPIADASLTVRLGLSVSGTVNLELGDTNLFSGALSVTSITEAVAANAPLGTYGVELDPKTGQGAAIANLFKGAVVIGYDLDAHRTNLNRRTRGQLLDTTYYNQVYNVPLRSPITVPRPLTTTDVNDSSDLAALITATHIRTSNAAVGELLRAAQILQENVNNADSQAKETDILGIARFLVRPFFELHKLNATTEVNSLNSMDRPGDIQAWLVNNLRDVAYRMYRDSNYKAAADALAGGPTVPPTVIIGTDPVISRYLTVTGDFRTLGNDFNVKIVSTLDIRMRGRMMMTFADYTTSTEGIPNPMTFGNMAWKPEMVLVLPLHRNGANSKELTVQPAFLHITNLPILASFEVNGIPDVASGSVAIDTRVIQ